jgi:sugar lactone lactonase YvrE
MSTAYKSTYTLAYLFLTVLAINAISCKKGNPSSTPLVVKPVDLVPTGLFVSTFSGNGTQGSANGDAASTSYYYPHDIVVDKSGNFYVTDFNNNFIRKITPAGVSSVFVGTGKVETIAGIGTAAGVAHPIAITIDSKENLYVSDIGNHILKISKTGELTFFAGGDGVGTADGVGTLARFNTPSGLTADTNDNIYVADENNSRIRKITPTGLVTTLAGNATQGKTDGLGTAASFKLPGHIAIDNKGNLYVSETGNDLIRKITVDGTVTTIAGSGSKGVVNGKALNAQFNNIGGLAVDADGNIYFAETGNNDIRKLSASGDVTTVAGIAGWRGADNGPAAAASFNSPGGIVLTAKGEIFVADTYSNIIRKISSK